MSTLPASGIITGAAGGIGRELTLTLAGAGIDVIATDLDQSRLDDLVRSAYSLPGRVIGVAGDMLDPELPARLCQRAIEDFGGVELLVNCSGMLQDARVQKMPVELFRRLININLVGPLRLIEAVAPLMKEAGKGRIISIASRAWLGNFGSSGYSCAKGGVVGASRALSLALAPHGITVNCIAPGFIETPMARSLPPHILERVLEAIPVGRSGTVEDIAGLVLYLASSASGYITGQTLVACGGRSISSPIAKSGEN
ncbi:SDR family NAD(P)-dependent oxidoreductase [Pseudomonas aeruginosa]|uniref:SDR family NAD(P)-dependent oxidoreductase n=3 Tax=Pseudomonas aeruginosa TaxID=287 RepID=UPI000F8247AA|nr:SDR family oxidoreductase [Pseudomonas aeruginosa]RTV63336.1 SDR family oxidoreductase [Pseudomonas aeruginosa]